MKSSFLLVVLLVVGTWSARAGTLTDALDGSLVKYEKNRLAKIPKGSLADKKVIALYYSAHWCPPCRAFTPSLVEEYNALSKQYPNFQLVFVSSDRDEKAMEEYMDWGKMEWPAIAYKKIHDIDVVQSLKATGIPYLVVVDADGKVLAGKGDKDWVSPQTILAQLKEILAKG